MRRLDYLAAALLVVSLISPNLATSQPIQEALSLAGKLHQEAQVSDPAGVHEYSQHLIKLLAGDNAGSALTASLSDRLARSEMMARHGKRKLISEADIARIFNDLMKQIGAPDSLKTDEASVRKLRANLSSMSPTTSSIPVDRNGANCNPGEAVFLLDTLLADSLSSESRPSSTLNARALLSAFSSQHPHIDTVKLFSGVGKSLRF